MKYIQPKNWRCHQNRFIFFYQSTPRLNLSLKIFHPEKKNLPHISACCIFCWSISKDFFSWKLNFSYIFSWTRRKNEREKKRFSAKLNCVALKFNIKIDRVEQKCFATQFHADGIAYRRTLIKRDVKKNLHEHLVACIA